MLFTKKKPFAVFEKSIKEDLENENGEILLKINLRFPELQCPKKDPLAKHALPFYQKFSEGFEHYAKNELFAAAKSAKKATPDSFKPFSAVMRFEKTFEDDNFLSILIDISVSDGISHPSADRKTQVWNRKTGDLCKCTDFFDMSLRSIIEKFIGRENKKLFDREIFFLREGGIEFCLRNGESIFVSTDRFVCQTEKNA